MSRAQRRGPGPGRPSRPPESPPSRPDPEPTPPADPGPARPGPRVLLAAAALLLVHGTLAVTSLLRENMTVDEVVHLPAALTYWQKGTFKLYPHNPPLIKLVAALPLLGDDPVPPMLYSRPGWTQTNKATFAHDFMLVNAPRYFEMFSKARLLMPLFTLLGGVLVFEWSRRLYGPTGGLLSLALWCLCPNILAHGRLVTTDAGATALGFGATYAFWHYLRRPTWKMAAVAGLALGVAQLAKFSMLLLFGIWPALWLIHEFLGRSREGRAGRFGRALGHAVAVVGLCVLVINVGYGFEGFGRPLGEYRFTCRMLTVDRPRPVPIVPDPGDPTVRIGQFRVNRFRDTVLGGLPVPLPRYYVSGFDDQKLEADGVPGKALVDFEQVLRMGPDAERIFGYPVFLDGELRKESWWYYYWMTLLYKVPEGTWALVLLSLAVTFASPRSRASWADELTLGLVPLVVLLVMSFGTNIALGLRYVLPIAPYVFASAGKLAPWAAGLGRWSRPAWVAIGLALAATAAATASIHPHHLAYFNWASGGPARGSEHLIDSNLDWGQDLVNLEAWLAENAPGERVGIAYFGQVNPQIFAYRGRPIDWTLPPAMPGTLRDLPAYESTGPAPGLYAVSASLVRGLPWRVYAPEPTRWFPYSAQEDAFGYFRELEPFATIGHSIFLYRVTEDDARRLARHWPPAAGG